MLQRLESDFLKKGIKSIILESSHNAFNFYLRHGYKKVKKKNLQFQDGTRISCVEMSKNLKQVNIIKKTVAL